MEYAEKGQICYCKSRFFMFRKQAFFLVEVKTYNNICTKTEYQPQQKTEHDYWEKGKGKN